jgi:rhamnogalacturonyl hydrolase YesR
MVIDAATCSSSGAFDVTGGFTEAREGGSTAYDCVDGYKAATGASETPSVTHSASFSRKTLIGFVVQAYIDPNKASNPSPSNGASGVSVSTSLSWDAPTVYTPSSYDVYFGTNSTAHSNPKYTVEANSYDPPVELEYGTTYYWAVDSNDSGTIYAGYDWSFTTLTSVGDRIANYILSKPLTDHYASACSYYGVLLYSELTENTELKNSVIAAYPPAYYDGTDRPDGDGSQDRNAYGILPFELYRQTGDANYLTLAVYLADEEFENPRPDGLAAYPQYTRFWIDDTYMIGSLQAQAYKSMGDIIYANRATVELLGYMGEVEQLQQPNGLFHHTTSVPIHWGRGNGWGAAAMTEVLLAIPEDDPNRPLLLSKYQAMMAGLVNYQDESGMWYQVLDMGSDPRNWVETSCTGMFVFALATGVKQGWLPEVPYKQAALDGWSALENYIDEQGRVHEVCMWVSATPDVNYYFNRAREIGNDHGQAAAIWAATAIERLNCEAEVVDFNDLKMLTDNWLGDEPAADIFPLGGDGIINFLDFAELAKDWLK